jgi:hypothetical protein
MKWWILTKQPKLTIKDKALIRCKLDRNYDYSCKDCEINKECNLGNNFINLAKELLIKLDIKWSD